MIRRLKQSKHPVWLFIFMSFALLLVLLSILTEMTEKDAHIAPGSPKQDITMLLNKNVLAEEDYQTLFYQTGLGKPAIDEIRTTGQAASTLLRFQQQFYQDINIACEFNSIISKEESIVDAAKNIQYHTLMAPLQKGDILLTKSSHTFGWRNGHAAIVVDSEQGKTLESVVLGTNSCIQDIGKWKKYPNFMILRLKGITPAQQEKLASDALKYLNDIPYDFTVGLLSAKAKQPNEIKGTQCSHLVWQAYQFSGYDIDSDGGIIVTPKDIANSPLLEVVQVYGVNPKEIWP